MVVASKGVELPWQFRKRIKLGPGVRLNIGQRNVSVTMGNRLARTTISSSGDVTQSQSIPGTGLYRTERSRLFPTDGDVPVIAAVPRAERACADAMAYYLRGDFRGAYNGSSKRGVKA